MSVDTLQEKIRKTKSPIMLELAASGSDLPESIRSQGDQTASAYGRMCRELLEALKGHVPAVRVSFSSFALLGADGISELSGVLKYAAKQGFYVALDAPEIFSMFSAQQTAQTIFAEHTAFPCDSLILGCYLGSDCMKPFLPACKTQSKDIFVAIRTANRSAPELQDLLAGGRLVHTAAADLVNRCGGGITGKYGYSSVGALSAANAPDSLKALRMKYPKLFLLIDGYNAVGANAKNCACAFDKFGRGAVVCDGGAIVRAWQDAGTDGSDYLQQAQSAVERMKRNLLRYITIL